MRSLLGRRPSPSMVVAFIALLVAMGGTGYAAIALPANSVGAKQLKKNAVTGSKIAPNAIDSSKVKNGSLLKSDFAPGALPAGAQGPQGPQGVKGDPGPTTGAAGGDLAGNYPNPTIAAGAVTASKLAPEEAWHEVGAAGQPPFENAWANYFSSGYATAAYFKDARGTVHLKGLVASGTSGPVFHLPVGYRPAVSHLFPAATDTGFGYVAVDGDGTVRKGSGGTVYLSLEIEFVAGS